MLYYMLWTTDVTDNVQPDVQSGHPVNVHAGDIAWMVS
jgi:hypothetical protein